MAAFVTIDNGVGPPGLGKVISVSGDSATVEYFHSPLDEPTILSIPRGHLRQVQVPPQTRVYWFDESLGAWRVGRIIDGEGQKIAIRFPNNDERILPAIDLHIRWDKPIEDPAPFLAQFVVETPLFADARSGFARALTAQRGACLGMSALISSGIELEAHQIEVVRRVLQDLIQRYLLADEVGLGKTIEAGILIRQYTLDEPDDHRVVVLVPQPLVLQWTDELRRRFYLRPNADDGKIRVVSTNEPKLLKQVLPDAGMLVVDEAHHLSSNRDLYDIVRNAAVRIPRLLLLSATPALRNETGFFKVLHLLDPAVYPLDGDEAFRHRIENRQTLAETVAALIPENVLQLGPFLDDIAGRFAGDTLLIDRIGVLRKVAATLPEEDDPELLNALGEVRSHLSEIYRLDRRILRNRRATLSVLTPKRVEGAVVAFRSESHRRLCEAIERWRTEAAHSVYGREDSDEAKSLGLWYADIIDCLLSEKHRGMERLVSVAPPGISSHEIFTALSAVSADDSRKATLFNALSKLDAKTKCVVFCSDEGTADSVASFLSERLGAASARASGEGREDTVTAFLENPECRVLVCDQADEEGLNLQGGTKAIFHYDLPLSPNRIEQRIGRLDRYGSGKPVQSLTLICTDEPYQVAWQAFVVDTLGVFRRSTASLQYLIEEHVQDLRKSLLLEGYESIVAMGVKLGGEDGEVEQEMRRIDHQDALDALLRPGTGDLEKLDDVDDDWEEFQKKVDDWLVTCLKMSRAPGPQVRPLLPGERVGRYALHLDGRNPTLIPLSRFVGTMLGALDPKAPGATYRNPLTFAYAARRRTVLSRKSAAAGVRILRYGDVLLEGLEAITRLEDRGRCFALWRHHPEYRPEQAADAFLRFDFIVEADISKAVELFVSEYAAAKRTAPNALQRRGDMLFPPFFHRVWLDEYLRPVDDPRLLYMLEAKYARQGEAVHRDVNLNPRRVRTLAEKGLPVVREWPTHVMRSRKIADETLRSIREVHDRASLSVARARTDDAGRFARLRMRIARDDTAVAEDRQRLFIEESVASALYDGILKPRVTLDTIGAVFLSNAPFAPIQTVLVSAEDE